MWPRFGIKVGNSTLCIAHVKADGKPEVIANKQGDRISQACLLWNEANEIECGLTAQQKMQTRPKQAVANSFQLLIPSQDLSTEKLKAAVQELPCDFDALTHTFQLKCSIQDEKNESETKENVHKLTPFEVQVQLFRAELELARQYYSDPSQKPNVVLSIPSYYPQTSWSQLALAAEEAGFHVAQIITEPTAAVLAYGIGETEANADNNEAKYILTIKSGGLFSHFALYYVRNGLYTQLDTYGPFSIGGRHFTDVLVEFICEEFKRKYKLDPKESRRSMAKIRNAAANCKHILTTLASTQLYIDSLMDGIDFNVQMSRARFESLIQPVINNFMQTLNASVDRAVQQHPEMEKVNAIVLLGATMRIPKLQSVLAARFPEAQLHSSLSADEVVAIGCARQSTFLLNPEDQDLEATAECTCIDEELLIWHGNDEANAKVLLRKGTLLPRLVKLDVKLSESAEDKELFKLRSGGNIKEVILEGATPADEGIFHIEADIECRVNDDTLEPMPVVKLRCV